MFDEIKPTGFSVPLCIAQLFGAPFFGMVIGFIALAVWTVFLGLHSPWEDIFAYVVYGAEGWLLGYAVQNINPRAIQSGGRWVWIIPICIFMWTLMNAVAAVTFFSMRSSRVRAGPLLHSYWP